MISTSSLLDLVHKIIVIFKCRKQQLINDFCLFLYSLLLDLFLKAVRWTVLRQREFALTLASPHIFLILIVTKM